jgi:Arm DNA-binding domain
MAVTALTMPETSSSTLFQYTLQNDHDAARTLITLRWNQRSRWVGKPDHHEAEYALGLFLLVIPNDDRHKGRLWRLRYYYGKSEKLLSLGSYPDVPLKRAREKRDEARRLLADGG